MSKANSRIIQVPATLDSCNRKKDKSVKFAFTTTREISTEEFMVMDNFHQAVGYLLFKENEFKEEEVPEDDVETDIEQSMSVQVRNALWVLFKAKGGNSQDNVAWKTFYRQQCRHFKTKILDEVHKIEESNE